MKLKKEAIILTVFLILLLHLNIAISQPEDELRIPEVTIQADVDKVLK